MIKSVRFFAAALAVTAVVAGQFAMIGEANASRRPHCGAIPVPGQPGVEIIVCSTARV